MNLMSFNWFDLVFLAVITIGVLVGRRRGMSCELLDLIQWLTIVVVSGFAYPFLGAKLAQFTGFSLTVSSILGYLSIALVLFTLFYFIKRLTGEKLVGSDTFGCAEYYLGMVAGGVRFFLILLFGLALFNAHQVTDQQLARQLRSQNEDLGAIYFPPYGSIQRSVFNASLSGQLIHEHLSSQLIQVRPLKSGQKRDTIWRQRERDVDEIVGAKR
jgi:uncharacterized membrane protein required for colicin V production